ncbi:Transglutaminase-like superfamily protein [compost metagenome]
MTPRQRCFACLDTEPPRLLEAALWIAAEHEPGVRPQKYLDSVANLRQQVFAALPDQPAIELAQPLLRRLCELDYQEDNDEPLRPQSALLHRVLQRRRGQPLSLAILALDLARQLEIPLQGVNFPGHFLLRVPGADHLLDPCTGRRLYPNDCRALLYHHVGPALELNAEHLQPCDARQILQRLSRNLRMLHVHAEDYPAALKDAERVLEFGPPSSVDHLARAEMYRLLDCPQAERYDLERALLLSDDPAMQAHLGKRLRENQARNSPLH